MVWTLWSLVKSVLGSRGVLKCEKKRKMWECIFNLPHEWFGVWPLTNIIFIQILD